MYDEEIEKAVLYYIIFKKEELDIEESDFINIKNKMIAKAVEELKVEKQDISILSVQNKIKGNQKQILEYISNLGNNIYGITAEGCYNRLKELSKKRKVFELAQSILANVTEEENIDIYIQDCIDKLNHIERINTKEKTFREQVAETTNEIEFTISRNKKEKTISMTLQEDENKVLKTGLYVKDQINGIGTLTYIDPETKRFGALGHEIIETTTAQKFEIKDGKIYNANVSNIRKSTNGNAGEKNASYNKKISEGEIDKNEISGIFGDYKEEIEQDKTLEVGTKDEVTKGKAYIRTNIKDDEIKVYEHPGNSFIIVTPFETVNYSDELSGEALEEVIDRAEASMAADMAQEAMDSLAEGMEIKVDYKRAGFSE